MKKYIKMVLVTLALSILSSCTFAKSWKIDVDESLYTSYGIDLEIFADGVVDRLSWLYDRWDVEFSHSVGDGTIEIYYKSGSGIIGRAMFWSKNVTSSNIIDCGVFVTDGLYSSLHLHTDYMKGWLCGVIAAHEIGHTYLLKHHNGSKLYIMNKYVPYRYNEPIWSEASKRQLDKVLGVKSDEP